MNYEKGDFLYEGKAKRAFQVNGHPELVWFEFKDALTAFNAEKKGDFADKGSINRNIAALVFAHLGRNGVEHHWVADIGEREHISKKLEIIPIEVVVRNILAGSTAKKFNIPEGKPLDKPLVEFFYKDDALGDPFISDEQALMLQAASKEELEILKEQALRVNEVLRPFFAEVGLSLVDFKLEFGRMTDGKIILADEVTPDTCRLWDADGNKLDKDRFRRDLGDVKESYEKVYQLLFDQWGKK